MITFVLLYLFVQFLIHAVDSGRPEKSSVQEVFVRVTRDEFPPTFAQAHFTADVVLESTEPGVRVFAFSASDQDLKVRHCFFKISR